MCGHAYMPPEDEPMTEEEARAFERALSSPPATYIGKLLPEYKPKGYLVWSLYTNGITHLRGVYTEEKKSQAYVAAADTKHEAQTVRSWVEEIELNSFFCELPNRPERKPNGL